MKKIIETTDPAGLDALLGEKIRLMCANYFYSGKLTGVNTTFVQLEGAKIIYDTDVKGVPTTTGTLPSDPWFVQIHAIESFGLEK
jgi:hypothetical protein